MLRRRLLRNDPIIVRILLAPVVRMVYGRCTSESLVISISTNSKSPGTGRGSFRTRSGRGFSICPSSEIVSS
jgi:hypothetical protein